MDKKLSIGYFADGKWAHEAFKLIIEDKNIDIKFICVRYDTSDEVLKNFSKEYNIDYLKHENINSKEFIDKVKEYNCDLFVSMSFNQIFKEEIINLPRLKTINCHAGKLPFYRGRNILNWVLINDEEEFGITVHYVDTGIDTGDIILQETYEITDEDNYNTLLECAYVNCAKLLYKTIRLLLENKAIRKKQDEIHPVGFYCGMRKMGDERLIWNQESRKIFNFVRAICKPGPMAQCKLNERVFKINKVKMIENAPEYIGIPGQILKKEGSNLVVKTKDTTVLVVEYEYDGKVRIGDRLI